MKLLKLIAICFVFTVLSPLYTVYGAAESKVVFLLNEMRIEMKISNSKIKGSNTKFAGAEIISPILNRLKVLTPQFSAEPSIAIDVIIIDHFEGEKTLQSDIQAAGYKVTPQINKLKKGHLYSWSTPSKSSAIYYYLQNPLDKKMALRIGPLSESVANDINFNWDNINWLKITDTNIRH